MKQIFVLVVSLCCLAGCIPAGPDLEPGVFTGTPSPPPQHLPLILKAETATALPPTPTPTSPPPSTITPTPTVSATMLPDLTIPYDWIIEYRDPCPWGSPGTITLKMQNIGVADAGPFVAAVFSDETNFAGLPAGAEAPLVYSFTGGPVGSIYAEADIYDQVPESNEQNNLMMIAFTPPPPCATVTIPAP